MPSLIAPIFPAALALVAADASWPLGEHLVWLPMTGATDAQMTEALQAGYDTILWKNQLRPLPDDGGIDFGPVDDHIARAREHGLKSILALLGEGGLGKGKYFDMDEQGKRLHNQLDPFWPEAMAQVEWAYGQVIDRYRSNPNVIAFAPTWGIYGEAGFKSFSAGRSSHALARFNEWRRQQGLPPMDAIPTRRDGLNTEYNRFIRFRYCYMEDQWDVMIRRLKARAGGKPVGTWQELYPVIGYLYNMVDVPSADFALYESCFPFQTTHHSEKTLAETMGFRYRCDSADSYRDYYLPLLARKRGEGQRFIGCQLTNEYASKNYKWPPEKAARIRFDQWEDCFAPYLRRLHNVPMEALPRDVLLVFPTYAAAALSNSPVHAADVMKIDVLLRMFGCQMMRCGSPALDKMTLEQMNRFRLIVVPCAAFLLEDTLGRLKGCSATVLFTGCFGQSFEAQYTPLGQEHGINGMRLRYIRRPSGGINIAADHVLTRHLGTVRVSLPEDESFEYVDLPGAVQVLLHCGEQPLLSTSENGRFIFLHGHCFAGIAYDPQRKPPSSLGGSADPSANEVDMWGPYSSAKPENLVGQQLMRNILDHAHVDYRVLDPKPCTATRYLGDHMEQASISGNIAYNNTNVPQELRIRLPYRPRQWPCKPVENRFEAQIMVPPFGYVVLEPEDVVK